MIRLDFDFHARRRRPGNAAIALLLAGVVALGAAWNALQTARMREAGLDLKIAALERTPRQAVTRPAKAEDATEARVLAQLAYAWQPAFAALAAARSDKIALLALDGTQAKNQLKLVAEARQLADAVEFVDALQRQPAVRRAALFRHEVQADAEQRPVRVNIVVELDQ